MVEPQSSKLATRVRFPSPAPPTCRRRLVRARWRRGPREAVRRLRPHHHLAQEVGARLGAGAVLLQGLPRRPACPPPTQALERTVLELLEQRAADATICPSEAARAVGGEQWRDLMEPARAAARRLVASGDVEITQGGAVVDPSTAKGPIRIRRVRAQRRAGARPPALVRTAGARGGRRPASARRPARPAARPSAARAAARAGTATAYRRNASASCSSRSRSASRLAATRSLAVGPYGGQRGDRLVDLAAARQPAGQPAQVVVRGLCHVDRMDRRRRAAQPNGRSRRTSLRRVPPVDRGGAVPVAPLRPGDPERVGPHRLLGRLGQGGMGTVFLGVSPDERAVAVKVLRDGLARTRRPGGGSGTSSTRCSGSADRTWSRCSTPTSRPTSRTSSRASSPAAGSTSWSPTADRSRARRSTCWPAASPTRWRC